MVTTAELMRPEMRTDKESISRQYKETAEKAAETAVDKLKKAGLEIDKPNELKDGFTNLLLRDIQHGIKNTM